MSPRDSGFTPVTYFSCTLGEAQQLNGGKVHFKSVIDLIDVQARRKPEEFAVGFPLPRDGNTKWTSQLFSKSLVLHYSNSLTKLNKVFNS